MMLRDCTLGRENGRVTLSCVAWNGGAAIRLLACGGRRRLRGFSSLWLFDRVAGLFLCSRFPGFSFPVSCLSILWFGPVLPVRYKHERDKQMNVTVNVWNTIYLKGHIIKACEYGKSYLKLMISNFFSL